MSQTWHIIREVGQHILQHASHQLSQTFGACARAVDQIDFLPRAQIGYLGAVQYTQNINDQKLTKPCAVFWVQYPVYQDVSAPCLPIPQIVRCAYDAQALRDLMDREHNPERMEQYRLAYRDLDYAHWYNVDLGKPVTCLDDACPIYASKISPKTDDEFRIG